MRTRYPAGCDTVEETVTCLWQNGAWYQQVLMDLKSNKLDNNPKLAERYRQSILLYHQMVEQMILEEA